LTLYYQHSNSGCRYKIHSTPGPWAQLCCKMLGDSLVWNQCSHQVDAEVTFYVYRSPILFVEAFWEQH